MLRQLTRADLPKTNPSGDSLHVPVFYKNEIRFVCDIHFGHEDFCYLEDNLGNPVRISECELIEDYETYVKVRKAFTPTPDATVLNKVPKLKAINKLTSLDSISIVALGRKIGIRTRNRPVDAIRLNLVDIIEEGSYAATKIILNYKQ